MKKILALALFAFLSFISPRLANASSTELLITPMNFTANSGSFEKYQALPANSLNNKEAIRLTYDLHGKCIQGGDASAIIFDQNGWKYVSLSNYGKNCYDGVQSVVIPLSDFPNLNTNTNLTGQFHVRFWSSTPYNIDITSALLRTVNPWSIRSVDAMKYTKDVICAPKDLAWVNNWLDKAVETGATHVAISQPYENPTCGDSVSYTNLWINVARLKGLKIWHRHMPLAHEGIYNTTKANQDDYFDIISNYIVNNPTMFVSGDIFTPIPEPQNGGISGVTYCPGNTCQYFNQNHFNRWLKTAMLVSELSFKNINKTGIKIGYFGFDGFVAFGHNNPDWNGILYNSTIARMGNIITLDHYPEAVGTNMATDLDEFHTLYPNVDVVIGEWGTISGTNYEEQVINSVGAAFNRSYIKGFNYWQPGPGGNEALWNSDFTNKIHFDEVKSYFDN